MPEALPSIPSFSEQQVHNLFNIVHSVVQQYFAPSNQTTPASNPPASTPSAPQETQKEEDEQLLQQVTVENITESTTKHPDSKSTLSIISRLCTARSAGDSAACLSNALLLACLLGYIEHSKDIKAIGQG